MQADSRKMDRAMDRSRRLQGEKTLATTSEDAGGGWSSFNCSFITVDVPEQALRRVEENRQIPE
eukprot:1591508-Pleurochrysis_carterae.AAC.1